ncbi:MAG: metallophosphoesterase family protein [Myxococcota bacterium]
MRLPRLALAIAALGLAPAAALAQAVTRGPYLQLTTPSSVTVRWRTDLPTDSVVSYGTTLALGAVASTPAPTTEHEVIVAGLPPATEHFYAVGNAAGPLAGGDASHFFVTAPTPGTATPTRIWVLGDSGKANQGARDVRDAYDAFTGSRGTDVWLMLGDNAYNDGTDAEFQAAVFDIYPETLRQVALCPTFGNHDANSASSATQTGPYYEIFSLPSGAEAGGVASGTEAYYAFDHANVHFVCLDSDDSDMSPGSPMLQWLEADLQATDQDWIIAYWHHAPYARGGMDSDLEWHGTAMRENVLPVLEAYGVDLVFSGHDHSYQRSFLVDGHYGLASSFTLAMAMNAGDGREGGDGAYLKPDGFAPHAGAVYTVAGNGASSSSGPFDHPTTAVAMDRLGSVVIDVEGNRLDAAFVDDAGVVADAWTLLKGPDELPPSLLSADVLDPYTVVAVFSEALDPASVASPSQWQVAPLETVPDAVLQPNGRSVRVSTSRLAPGSYTLSVSGVADHFGNVIPAGTEVDFSWSAARTVERAVAAGQDDAEQAVAGGAMDLAGGVLELGSADATPQLVGLRFTDLPLPAGATVDGAYVQFQVQQRSRNPASLLIEADAADDAPPFTATPYDLEARLRTAAAVPWTPPDWKKGGGGLAGARTPELAPLLQELVDRAGWIPGNAIALVFSGTGSRAAKSRDATPSGAALLHVDYTLPLPACSDGIDNDGDGQVDYPLDPECTSDEADRERRLEGSTGCGLGPELVGALALLLAARARRRRPSASSEAR